jgi:hypothetical protein
MLHINPPPPHIHTHTHNPRRSGLPIRKIKDEGIAAKLNMYLLRNMINYMSQQHYGNMK